jgi:hypothetical protein
VGGRADALHRDGDVRLRELGAGANREHVAADRHAHAHRGVVFGTVCPRAANDVADLQLDVGGATGAHRDDDLEKPRRADRLTQEHRVGVLLAWLRRP